MDRLTREIEFHDQRYADGTGSRPQDHFYVAVRGASELAFAKVVDCARQGGAGLEIGCATGYHTSELLKLHRYRATGIDVSSTAVAVANRHFEGAEAAPVFKVMDANHLEFADGSFDFVFGNGVIHHLELPRAIHEARRVLRPGGRFVFMEPLGTNPLINWYRRSTPQDRSPDEVPLTGVHLAQLRESFDEVQLRYFGLLTLGTIPLRRWPLLQRTLLAVTSALDRVLLAIPLVNRLGWMVVIDARVAPRRADA